MRETLRIPRRRPVGLLRGIASSWRHSWRQAENQGVAPSRLMMLLRPLRVLLFPRIHHRMLRLTVYRQFSSTLFRPPFGDAFHHLSGKHYLRQGLGVRQRIQYAFAHYEVESRQWHSDYHVAVYGREGLTLWRHEAEGSVCTIRLNAEHRWPEGDLRITVLVDDQPLHFMNFSWLVESRRGVIVPFIGRSQGDSVRHPDARAAFDRCVPHNSAMYFCYAAVVGMARAVGAPIVIGVRGREQTNARPDEDARFHRNYDGFWESLGGNDEGGFGIEMPLPNYDKPASNLSASHRRRARKRRRLWADIADATTETLRPLFLGGPITNGCAKMPVGVGVRGV